jgi:CheY-like chemotaxis protein
MPVVNGIQCLHHIRTIDKKIPVIALTAFAMIEDVERFKKEGFTDYITKPVNKNKLLSKIKTYTGK